MEVTNKIFQQFIGNARSGLSRVVKVLPSQWRGPVLGRDAVRMPREQVRALEVQCAYRYFSRTLDRLNASHHHPDIA